MSPTSAYIDDVQVSYSGGLPCSTAESSATEDEPAYGELSEDSTFSEESVSVRYETDMVINVVPKLGRPLSKAIPLKIQYEDGFFSISNKELQILVGGETCAEALEEFYTFFCQDYRTWIETPDERLTEKALRIKKKYLEYVGIQV